MADGLFISEEDVEKALNYLRDNAPVAAKARAERIYVEEYRKTVKAQLMQEHKTESGIAQEREAYADPRYSQHLDAIREAIEIDENHRFMREAAAAKIEAWRTASSNYRSMKV